MCGDVKMELSRGYQSDCACEKNILLTNVRRRNKDIKAVKRRVGEEIDTSQRVPDGGKGYGRDRSSSAEK